MLMNDKGYGVIKNIQDVQYGGRRCYADLHTPDYAQIAAGFAMHYSCVRDVSQFKAALREAAAHKGPCFVEIDMLAIGSFKTAFSGPPVNVVEKIPALSMQ